MRENWLTKTKKTEDTVGEVWMGDSDSGFTSFIAVLTLMLLWRGNDRTDD